MATISTRLTSAGQLLINGSFDEFTGAQVFDANTIAWIDGGQTASYSGSGTVWTDLTTNAKNYNLVNSPTFDANSYGGTFTFAAASSQYAVNATTLYDTSTNKNTSKFIWVYPTSAGQIISVLGQITPNTSYHYTAIEISAAGLIRFGIWTGSMTTIASSSQSLNAWYHLGITISGTTVTAYVNGVSVGSITATWTPPGASTFYALMAIDSTNMSASAAYCSGLVGQFTVYNRGLTATEVAQNYNGLASRYGLPLVSSVAPISRQTGNLVLATLLDEVTGGGSTAVMSRYNNGNLVVKDSFDEFTGAPVVDANLKFWLDAAQTSSYSGTGTTWSDLSSQRYAGTLVGSPTFDSLNSGGAFTFNGTSQYASTNVNVTVTSATFLAWIKRNGLSAATYSGILFSRGGTSTTISGLDFFSTTANLGYHWNDALYTFDSNLTVPNNTWCMAALTVNSTVATFYVNTTSSSTSQSHASSTINGLAVAYDQAAGLNRYFKGDISDVMFYDRALSADEIAQNFNALRRRYGI